MEYQLVIKLWRSSLAGEEFLATLQERLKQALGELVELEGHDVGAKEVNVFMLTDDPRRAFRKAKDLLESVGVKDGISAAFRLHGGAQFTSLWPLRATRKFKLP